MDNFVKISDLDQHCGECAVIDYCGGYDYFPCCDERFADVDIARYKEIADNASATKEYEDCAGCAAQDCDNVADTGESCEYNDLQNDWMCRQIADFVYAELLRKEPCR